MNLEIAIREMAGQTELSPAFAKDFYQQLTSNPNVQKEFETYLTTGNFTCETKIQGYSVLDIMIWQMDHFKAWLDRDTHDSKGNKDYMVLMAFDTLLKMFHDPYPYIAKMQSETGTDYAGKSFFY